MADATETITAAVSDRICNHMNKDHGDAVLLYAQYFGALSTAEAATLLKIDGEGMDLQVTIADGIQPLRIPFPRPLADAKDAHVVLVEMMKTAQGVGDQGVGDQGAENQGTENQGVGEA
jgi:putative heme iron utilization protein